MEKNFLVALLSENVDFVSSESQVVLGLVLEEAAVFEVVSDDDIGDGVKDELDVGGVCGAGEVCVDLLLVLTLVQVLKFHLDVCRTVVIVVRTFVFRKTNAEWAMTDLHLEEVLLVQEQND